MKKLLVLLAMAAMSLGVIAQNENNKLSVTTQMFLNELKGDISFERDTKAEKQLQLVPVDDSWRAANRNAARLYAAPDTISGRAFIAAYVRLNEGASTSELESLGVVVQEGFDNGLYTTLIPVDKIEAVAQLSGVKRINVSPLKRPFTNAARQKTNVDDILSQSSDAIAAGLTQKYDGSGVVLGVIDTGIDFNHIAFKDANGTSRIKQAYVYNGSRASTYTGSTITSTLTDDNSEDHGTHTSTTAGGSSVVVNGTTVTVTDDHSKATYGGMAPGADLYLAGVNGLSSTYMDNAVKNMCTYADQQGLPLVVSNSWGSQMGPHDGTGDEADVYNSLFGDSHPNRVALFAASNDGGKSKDGEGGGYHLTGTATSSSPLRSILRSASYTNTDAGYYYNGVVANAWARSTSVSSMSCKIYVLDSSTGAVKTSVTVNPTANGASVSGLSSYYSGTLYAFKDYISSDKTQILLYSSGLESKSTTTTTKNGSTYYKSAYTLAVEFYPSSGSSVIDVWGGSYCYFTNHLTTSGYSWKAGSDDGCFSDEATIANVIPIGAYVSKTDWTDYSGTSRTSTDHYTMGDIAYFSSWGTAANNPTGTMIPWISAPGARLAAGVNHNHTTSVDSYSYYGSDNKSDLVVNNASNPYAMMEGTSMATPTAAGIVALWLQAAKEVGKELTVNDIKEVMKLTAITDNYTTTGANKDHFGNGKIDALAGIKYILGATSEPTITVDSAALNFDGFATQTYTKTIKVKGLNLTNGITVTKSGSNTFTIDKTSISQTNGVAEADITVTWKPTAAGTQSGTLTLKSDGASNVTVTLTGTAQAATPTVIADKESLDFSALLGNEATQTVNVTGRFLTGNVTVSLKDDNGVFAVSSTSISATDVLKDGGVVLDVTFSSEEEGTYTGTLTLTSNGAQSVTIPLTAEASDGGTASDAYLNIAKYATIDDAGWNKTYVNALYKYTEYTDDEVAWLTLPLYGAWVGVFYDSHPQKWIESSMNTTNTYSGVTWNASDVLMGSGTYFTGSSGNGRARAIGYNSQNNTAVRAVTFYVTNTTAIKLYGLGRSGVNSTYPAAIKVYECNLNGDGSLTASSTVTKSATSTSTSTTTPYNISVTGLDASKIYKVEASNYRGYMYEIAFQTPIEVAKDPVLAVDQTELSYETPVGTTADQTVKLTAKNLTGDVTANVSGEGFSIDATTISAADARAGKTITVSFKPTTAGTVNGSVTFKSADAEDVTVALTGVATQPYLMAEPEEVTFELIEAESTTTATFEVLGEHLGDVVTLTLEDADGVFALDTESISIADAEEGATVTVTFAPQAQGTYSGTVTLSTPYADDVVVTLTAEAKKKTPDYYDVTINSYGVGTLYLDFPVEIPYDEYDPDLLGVYYGYEVGASELRVARLSRTIPAYTAVIVQGNSGTYRFPKATGEVAPLKYENHLLGTLESITVAEALEQSGNPSGVVYTLGRGPAGYIGFYRYSGTRLSANRAYLVIDDASAKGFNVIVEDELTGIKSLDVDTEEGTWHTLEGIQFGQKPTKRGVYIQNGKKVVIK